MSRVFRFAFTSFATFFALVAIGLGLLSWKMLARPLSSSEMTPYVEEAFAYLLPGVNARINHSVISWDNHKHTLSVLCDDVKLLDKKGDAVVAFPSVNLKLSVWSLLRGSFLPTELKADNAKFFLTHSLDGSWYAGGAKAGKVSGAGVDVFSLLQDIGDDIASNALSHDIAIKQAVFTVYDEALKKEMALTAREITLDHKHSVAVGRAKIELQQEKGLSHLDASYEYARGEKLHKVFLDILDFNPAILARQYDAFADLGLVDLPLTGSLTFGTDRDLNISEATLQLVGGAGSFKNSALWDKPCTVKSLNLLASFNKETAQIELKKLDVDLGGPLLTMSGYVDTPPPARLIWMRRRQSEGFELKIGLENLMMEQFGSVWPKPIIPNPRIWISERMTKGRFSKGSITLRGPIDWRNLDATDVATGEGEIAAEKGTLLYMDGMPPVENTSAKAVFDLKHMDVKILSGHSGDVDIKPFTLKLTDFEKDTQYIFIPAHIHGPASSVLKILDSKPLGYAKAIGINPVDASGIVDGTLNLSMPLLNDLSLDQVTYKASARFQQFGLKNMVPHIEISKGTLAFNLGDGGFTLEGPVSLNTVPFNLVWKSRFEASSKGEPLHQGLITGSIKNDQWSHFRVGHLIQTEGFTPVKVHYANARDGFSTLQGSFNFKNALVHIPHMAWTKARGVDADLNVSVEIEKGENVRLTNIDLRGGAKLVVQGTAELDPETALPRKAHLSPYIVGRNNAAIDYEESADPSGPILIKVIGKSLDISEFGVQEEKGATQAEPTASSLPRGGQFDLVLKKLYTGPSGYMVDVKASATRKKESWTFIDFQGLAQGTVPISVSLRHINGRQVFEASSNDFGTALKGLGFTETIEGGRVKIKGESLPGQIGPIRGKLKVSSFSVTGMSLLARLLSATSLFGIVDLITGDATFDHLRGHFSWDGGRIELSKVRAAGSVVGLNLEGHVDLQAETANLSGTLVPFSFVNSIIGSIPLLGDVITGGDGQGVIAASYKVRGPLSNLDISVNPVSLLTPGFLRNLFFPGEDVEDN